MPGTQEVQLVSPVALAYVPARQFWQALRLAAAGVGKYVPGVQGVQPVSPMVLAYVPGKQS